MFAEKENMGSVEVYDYDKMQWVPYVPDFNKWIKHFEDISAGRVRPDYKGRYIVGSGSQHRHETPSRDHHPFVKLVTPVAQAIEMAKSELERENDNSSPKKRKFIRKREMYRPPGRPANSKPRTKKPKLTTQFDD